jgi:DNA-binding MarR family transcriptional regulator
MKLEEEIKQKAFKSPYQKLAVNLLYTSNWLSSHYGHFFKDVGLSTQQYNVLRILRGQYPKPCSLKLIKERMLDRMSDASRIVDKLVAKNYVHREECPSDRRSVNLLISDEGLALLERLDFVDEATREIFGNLQPGQVEQLNELLDDLRGSAPSLS